ncbi:hypothetical protein ACSVDA_15195 [Cytobacillus sp. Hm23]
MDIRVHIIGGAGSGKTYTAKQLSEMYKIPHLDLDQIFWDHQAEEYGIKASAPMRDNNLKGFVEHPSWIIEGVYFTWLAPSFALADQIFVLQTPLSIQENRIWSRFQKRKTGLLPSTKKETTQSIQQLIEWNKKYNQDFLPNFIRNTDYKDKIIQFENSESIIEHVSKLLS